MLVGQIYFQIQAVKMKAFHLSNPAVVRNIYVSEPIIIRTTDTNFISIKTINL